MKQAKNLLLVITGIFAFGYTVFAQSGVVVYNAPDFQGANMTLNASWKGGSGFDRIIKSIRIPSGYRVTLFSEKNYKGTQAVITEDWNPGAGAWWTTRVRSIRIDAAQIQPPITLPTPSPSGFPVIYAQADYQGPAMAVERDWSGSRDWEGRPHQIRSIRVPSGWYLVLYDKRNFRGKTYNLNADWTPQQGDYWNGRIKSIKVYKGTPPKQPR